MNHGTDRLLRLENQGRCGAGAAVGEEVSRHRENFPSTKSPTFSSRTRRGANHYSAFTMPHFDWATCFFRESARTASRRRCKCRHFMRCSFPFMCGEPKLRQSAWQAIPRSCCTAKMLLNTTRMGQNVAGSWATEIRSSFPPGAGAITPGIRSAKPNMPAAQNSVVRRTSSRRICP